MIKHSLNSCVCSALLLFCTLCRMSNPQRISTNAMPFIGCWGKFFFIYQLSSSMPKFSGDDLDERSITM